MLFCVLQGLKLGLLLLPCLLVAGVSATLFLALYNGQVSTDDVIDAILPQPQRLKTPHPILVGAGGEPLQLADGQPLGIAPNPADGGKTLALVSSGRPVRGMEQKALTFNLGGPKGRTLVDDAGAVLLGSGGLPLDVSGPCLYPTLTHILSNSNAGGIARAALRLSICSSSRVCCLAASLSPCTAVRMRKSHMHPVACRSRTFAPTGPAVPQRGSSHKWLWCPCGHHPRGTAPHRPRRPPLLSGARRRHTADLGGQGPAGTSGGLNLTFGF